MVWIQFIVSLDHFTEEKTEGFEAVNACASTDASTKGQLSKGTIECGHLMHASALSLVQRCPNCSHLLTDTLLFLWTRHHNRKSCFLRCRNVKIGNTCGEITCCFRLADSGADKCPWDETAVGSKSLTGQKPPLPPAAHALLCHLLLCSCCPHPAATRAFSLFCCSLKTALPLLIPFSLKQVSEQGKQTCCSRPCWA